MNETDLENMISFNLFNPTKWCNKCELNLKEYKEYLSKFLKLSNLNINTIDDLAGKLKTPIYYLFSCVRNHFFNEGIVETSLKRISVSPDFYDYDEINFFTKICFYDEPKNRKGLPLLGGEKWKLNLNLDLMIYFIKKHQFL